HMVSDAVRQLPVLEFWREMPKGDKRSLQPEDIIRGALFSMGAEEMSDELTKGTHNEKALRVVTGSYPVDDNIKNSNEDIIYK
ncbi:hypothetical protein M3M33_15975, partial [Loigolactobacillus coryniformis]|uniref:hypothetical protein n=1 Tax=Loigolactobacillus coryniformis TaxID=1610 RepID=UPI00201A5A4A